MQKAGKNWRAILLTLAFFSLLLILSSDYKSFHETARSAARVHIQSVTFGQKPFVTYVESMGEAPRDLDKGVNPDEPREYQIRGHRGVDEPMSLLQCKTLLIDATKREVIRYNSGTQLPPTPTLPFLSRECFAQRVNHNIPFIVRPAGSFHMDCMYRNIEYGNGFAWIRWGDGELNCLVGRGGGPEWSCDSWATEELQNMLKIYHNNYFLALGSWWACTATFARGLASAWREIAPTAPENFTLVDSFYLEHARSDKEEGLVHGMVGAVRRGNRPVILVGDRKLRNVPRTLYNYTSFIEVPARGMHTNDVPSLLSKLRDMTQYKPNHLCLVAAGLIGKIFITQAHTDFLLDRHIYVDVGSSLDIFVGSSTRDHNQPKYIKEYCSTYPSFMMEGLC